MTGASGKLVERSRPEQVSSAHSTAPAGTRVLIIGPRPDVQGAVAVLTSMLVEALSETGYSVSTEYWGAGETMRASSRKSGEGWPTSRE